MDPSFLTLSPFAPIIDLSKISIVQPGEDSVPLWRRRSAIIKDYLHTNELKAAEKYKVALETYGFCPLYLASEQNFRKLPGGTSGREPLLIHAKEGNFVLKFASFAEEEALFVTKLINHAFTKNVPVPALRQTRDGASYCKIGEAFCYLEAFVPQGFEINLDKASAAHMFSLGKFTADFHSAVRDFNPSQHKNELLASDVVTARSDVALWLQKAEGLACWRDSIFKSFDMLEAGLSKERYESLPTYVVHGDLKLGNVKFKSEDGDSGVLTVFDWERCRSRQSRLEDFKNALLAMGRNVPRFFKVENLRSFLLGYQNRTDELLTRAELDSLQYFLGAGAYLWDVARVLDPHWKGSEKEREVRLKGIMEGLMSVEAFFAGAEWKVLRSELLCYH